MAKPFRRHMWAVLALGTSLAVLSGCGASHPTAALSPRSQTAATPKAHRRRDSDGSSLLRRAVSRISAPGIVLLAPDKMVGIMGVDATGGRDHYDVRVKTAQGAVVSFGGQNYGTPSMALSQLQRLLVVSPGPGTPLAVGAGVVAHAYPQQSFITWSTHRWIVQVSGSPGTLLASLKDAAAQIAATLQDIPLPATAFGVLTWSHASDGQNAIDLSWQVKSSAYWVKEDPTAAVKQPMAVAAAMTPVQAP